MNEGKRFAQNFAQTPSWHRGLDNTSSRHANICQLLCVIEYLLSNQRLSSGTNPHHTATETNAHHCLRLNVQINL